MKDRWLNSGYHGEQLQPYVDQAHDIDSERVGKHQCNVIFSFVLFCRNCLSFCKRVLVFFCGKE